MTAPDVVSPSVIAVIPHFQSNSEQLSDLVRSVQEQTGGFECDIVVVANNPGNGAFRAVADTPAVVVLEAGLNLGYVGALEWARRTTSADLLWVLQEDLIPLPNCLAHLVTAMQEGASDRLAVTSPIEVDESGRIVNPVRAMAFDVTSGCGRPLTADETERLHRPTGWSSGHRPCFVLLSGALMDIAALRDIGGFDVGLWPLMLVDTETCLALQSQGFTIQIVDQARIIHDRRPPTSYPRFHHWKQTALARNTKRVARRYHAAGVEPRTPAVPELPPEVLYALAQGMSEFIGDYAAWVHATSWRRVAWQAKRRIGAARARSTRAMDALRKVDGRSSPGRAAAAIVSSPALVGPWPLPARALLEATLPTDPLAGSCPLPAIDVLIPCHGKDSSLLPVALAGAVAATANPVAGIRVVCPQADHDAVHRLIKRADLPWPAALTIHSDDEVLGGELLELVARTAPTGRRGWVVQQLVKLMGSAASDAVATLVVDADTVLLRQRTWVTASGVQLLPVVREFHRPYAVHARRVWGAAARELPVSFVAHHMLLQRDVLGQMLGPDLRSGLMRWIDALDWRTNSPGSEYQSYATWLMRRHPDRVMLGQWANASVVVADDALRAHPSEVLSMLQTRLPHAWSMSRHDWLASSPATGPITLD